MQKLYYSITEVSREIDEETHILRYWQKEFPQLNPKKNSAGNRVYSENDLNIVRQIKSLIRDEKLSLAGAKAKMAELHSSVNKNESSNNSLSEKELTELKDLLKDISEFLKK